MGWFDNLFRRNQNNSPTPHAPVNRQYAVAASADDVSMVYSKDIAFKGRLAGFDYTQILRNKQKHIQDLFALADYYADADPLVSAIIKQVYIPFCTIDGWKLVGANQRVKMKYEAYYERIGLREKLQSIFTQVIKYSNVVIYLMPDGDIITLPIHYCRISNIEVNGQPVVQFHCRPIRDDYMKNSSSTLKKYIEDRDLFIRLAGYPPEVSDGIIKGTQWVQLDPYNTYVFQGSKEGWLRYAIPSIAGCLTSLQKKQRIMNYENSLLDLGGHSFLHVTYGDDNEQVLPTVQTLARIGATVKEAMTTSGIAVTNHHATVHVIQPNMNEFFSDDKYASVNNDILSAFGISGVIISGSTTDGSSFASAQVSSQTIAIRVRSLRNKFCDIMNKINRKVNLSGSGRMAHSAECQIPRFTFPPVDLNNSKALQEAYKYLHENGLMSHQSLLDSFGVDMMEQCERKKKEQQHGINKWLSNPDESTDTVEEESSGNVGRTTLDDSQRTSDPIKSATGRLPKASNPEGSEAQDTVNTVE